MFASARYSANLASLRVFSRWDWMSSGEEPGGHASAPDTTAGKVALVLAFVAVLLAALDLRGGERRYRSGTTALAVLAALIVAYKGWSLADQFNSVAASHIAVHASIGIGVWVALLGGVAGALGRWMLAHA